MEAYTFRVSGMDCASCAANIQKGVARLDGVTACELSFSTELLRVQGSTPPERIVARVRELGYDAAPASEPTTNDRQQQTAVAVATPHFLAYLWQRHETRLALLGALLILPGLLFNELLPIWQHPILDVTSVAAMIAAGYPIARSALRTLRVNREININLLMTIAAIGAVVIGAYSEAGLVMVLFALGEALEGFTAARARDTIRQLMTLAPSEAAVLRPCIDCAAHLGQNGYTGGPCPICGLEEQRVPVTDLRVGETIVVKPGERVPMDGRILSGYSSVNQATITGESRLIEKAPGDTLFASSINGAGTLEVEVTHLASDNTIARLIQMVEQAQERRAPAQRFVDQFARVYTPLVVGVAALVAIVPPLFWDAPFWGTQGWLYRALALLVVACPCALVISTPVSLISAISNGARQGVLFKGGAYLEMLSRVRAIAFDKTGTLTTGQPAVVTARALACVPDLPRCAACDDLLALAVAVEQRSEHPLAQAIVSEAAGRGVLTTYPAAANVTALMGQGVTGQVNGRTITIGSHTFFADHQAHADHCTALVGAQQAGQTTMLVSADGEYCGFIATADTVRHSSATAVAELRTLGIEHLVMITGDHADTAAQIAAAVGIDRVRAHCLPEDKVTAVAELGRQHGTVAMVGDGINDTPALATASVGIAIGSSAQAMETADIVLMSDDLRRLPFAIRLARATMRTIYANVALSIGIKLAFFVLVLLGMGSMWLAVFADMGASLLVTLNGMRLRYRPTFQPALEPEAAQEEEEKGARALRRLISLADFINGGTPP